MLTLQQLKDMEPHSIFAKGQVEDNHLGANRAGTGKLMKWVAVRGGIHDWAIYCDNPYKPQINYNGVKGMGDKIRDRDTVKRLVSCDKESLEMYRD